MSLHGETVFRALEEMRRRYRELPEPTDPRDKLSRTMTYALHEALMLPLADCRDGVIAASDEDFAQAATHAIGNVLASIASCVTQSDAAMKDCAGMLCTATVARAMGRVLDPNRGHVMWTYGEVRPS